MASNTPSLAAGAAVSAIVKRSPKRKNPGRTAVTVGKLEKRVALYVVL
jgi:hypothetical protein